MSKLALATMLMVVPTISFAQTKPTDDETFWKSRPWTNGEIAMAGSYILASTLDAFQTSKIKEIYGASEGNPLLRNDDGSPNMTRVIVLKSIVVLGALYIVDHMPHADKRIVLVLVNSIQWGIVVWNEGVTGGILLKW